MANSNLYSIVIPVYKSEQVLEKTVLGILAEQAKHDLRTEIVLVDDGSPDLSWAKARQLADENEHIKAIRLTRNYGQHTAIYCGLSFCEGDYIITMDDDGQNPASEIIKLVNKISEGYDAVFGQFPSKKHAFYRRLGSKIIRYLNRAIFRMPDDLILSNFRIFTRETANNMLQYQTNYPYIPGLILLSGASFANVETLHKSREVGQSNYSLRKILKLVSRLLINYSSYPLRILSYVGLIFTIVPFSMAGYAIINSIVRGSEVKGWTSLMVVVSLFNAITLIMISIIGMYLSRMMNQQSQPPYLIRESRK